MYDCNPATGFMPDDGTGDKEIYRVENFELVPVNPDAYGKFFGGDSYVIKYKYYDGAREKYIIYFWQVSKHKHYICSHFPSKFVKIAYSMFYARKHYTQLVLAFYNIIM